jgi:hypothetical protein
MTKQEELAQIAPITVFLLLFSGNLQNITTIATDSCLHKVMIYLT